MEDYYYLIMAAVLFNFAKYHKKHKRRPSSWLFRNCKKALSDVVNSYLIPPRSKDLNQGRLQKIYKNLKFMNLQAAKNLKRFTRLLVQLKIQLIFIMRSARYFAKRGNIISRCKSLFSVHKLMFNMIIDLGFRNHFFLTCSNSFTKV